MKTIPEIQLTQAGDYLGFLCLTPPKFVAELDPEGEFLVQIPESGAALKDNSRHCVVSLWLENPTKFLDGDGIARHVRLAFERALELEVELENE